MTYNEKKQLCEKRVTLNGKSAVISGAKMEFASVSQIPEGASYEWAWETVDRIAKSGGKFYS